MSITPATEKIWELLLILKPNLVPTKVELLSSIFISWDQEVFFEINPSRETLEGKKYWKGILIVFRISEFELNGINCTVLKFSSIFQLVIVKGELATNIHQFLNLYFPYLMLPFWASTIGKTISIAHFAQSLDGKIATIEGHSKWIGSKENIIHAHRMRALCDCILIGKQTLIADKPSLTVRHVKGTNPKRVVIGYSKGKFESLFNSWKDSILVIDRKSNQNDSQTIEENIELVALNATGKDNRIPGIDIFKALFQLGYHSVYVEGGSYTTSSFIIDKSIDILQLHLAPMIFGSGISALQLPSIEKVGEAITFSASSYSRVGDEMMFSGILSSFPDSLINE